MTKQKRIISPPPPSIWAYVRYTWVKTFLILYHFFLIVFLPFMAIFQSFWPASLDKEVKEHAVEKFIHPGGKSNSGILFIHGFGTSPQIFDEYLDYFVDKGYVIQTVRLEGHGTSYAHFASTSCVDWYLSAREKFFELKEHVDHITIIAHSLGTLLSVILASNYKIDAMVLLSSPIKLRAKPLYRVNFMLRPVAKFIKYWPVERAMLKQTKKQNFKIYNFHPLDAVANLIDTIAVANERLPKITTPLLLMIGDRDEFSEVSTLDIYKEQVQSEIVDTWVAPDAPHVILATPEREEMTLKIRDFVLKHSPPKFRSTKREK